MSYDWEHSSTVHSHNGDSGSDRDDKVWYPNIEKLGPRSNLPSSGTHTGTGTPEDPFIIDWDLGDPEDPYNWSKNKKWLMTMQVCPRM